MLLSYLWQYYICIPFQLRARRSIDKTEPRRQYEIKYV